MDRYHDGLMYNNPSTDPEVIPEQPPLAYVPKQDQQNVFYPQSSIAPAQTDRTICGIRKITFLLLVIIVVLILAGAIGGGVGGSIAVQNARNSVSNSAFVITLFGNRSENIWNTQLT